MEIIDPQVVNINATKGGADRKARWKEYFVELYSPNIMTDHTYEAKIMAF